MKTNFDKDLSSQGIAFHKCGSGPSLILIHGVGLRGESWYQYIEALKSHFELIILDLPGHGASRPLSVSHQDASLSHYSDSISKFVDEVTDQPFYLCGHSLGALIAIEMAAVLQHRLEGLIALNSILGRSDSAQHAVRARAEMLHESDTITGVGATIERWFGKQPKRTHREYASLCEQWLRGGNQRGYAMAYKAFADQTGPSTETLESISCISRYITGESDLNSSPQMTHNLAELSANSQAVVVQEAGHMMPLTHAEEVIREILLIKSIINKHSNTRHSR